MTTLIAKIYPYFTDYNCKEDFIAFNCAFDRQAMRSKNDDYLKDDTIVNIEEDKKEV